MNTSTIDIVKAANKIVKQFGTRDPIRIANELGIELIPAD